MPSGPGVIDEAMIRRIAAGVPRGVATFLLTSRTDPEEIAAQQRDAGADTLQLVDRLAPDALRRLRRRLPGISLVQVVHVRGEHSVEEAVAVAPLVDAVLRAVRPFGVDVCSGVRTDGRLDESLLRRFMRAARGGARGTANG